MTPMTQDWQELGRLLLAEAWAADAYGTLAGQLGGRAGERLYRLAREARSRAACLKGICLLMTGTAPQIPPIPPEPGTPQTILRRSYGKALGMLGRYEARQGDPEYGPVFRQLAAQQQAHCYTLLELMGTLPP